jgi:surfactin synthase thioesterase subunit
VNLFTVPYAGGNAWAYRGLEAHLRPAVTVTGVELPGRGRRSHEPLMSSLEQLADDVFQQIRPQIARGPYAFFGHSMGGLLAFLASRRIQHAGLPMPAALFVSGSEAPSAQAARERHRLTTPAFVTMLRDMGGCPPEVLADRELIAFFEPVLRADFKAVETWNAAPGEPLGIPLTVMIGRDEEVTEATARPWAAETTGPFAFHTFEGNHFFIVQHWNAIAALIREQLSGTAPAPLGVGHVDQEPQFHP